MNYFFHPGAESEHLETIAYYESRKTDLGANYLSEFEKVVAEIIINPLIYPIDKKPDIRRKRMIKFPFTILFRTFKNTIQILAIAHHRRRPNYYWLDRR